MKTNDHVTIGAWTGMDSGSGINQPEGSLKSPSFDKSQALPGGTYFEMPNIAQSWSELKQVLESSGALLARIGQGFY